VYIAYGVEGMIDMSGVVIVDMWVTVGASRCNYPAEARAKQLDLRAGMVQFDVDVVVFVETDPLELLTTGW
jgi:hypothetical protein